jgi:hypothetical protein
MNPDFVPAENPFCTKRVRPGSLPFIFPLGLGVETLVERLRQTNWWGEVVGPHGSGKSALLATLMPAIERAGHPTLLVELHDGQRRLPPELLDNPNLCAPAVLVIDGYEQLGRWSRHRLSRLCRRRAIGLVVTTHQSVGLPEVYQTVATPELAAQIVAALVGDRKFSVSADEIACRFSLHRGDLRETLFDLYDLFEESRLTSGRKVT